jgi:hypothetical protein
VLDQKAPASLNYYDALGRELYWVALNRIQTSAEALDWIYQLLGKPWLSDRDLRDFLEALDETVGPIQEKYCAGIGR